MSFIKVSFLIFQKLYYNQIYNLYFFVMFRFSPKMGKQERAKKQKTVTKN